jgi:hypothetical protein
MNGSSDEFLARTGFAFDQNGGIRRCDRPNEIQNALKTQADSYDAFKVVIHTFGPFGLTASGFDGNRRC